MEGLLKGSGVLGGVGFCCHVAGLEGRVKAKLQQHGLLVRENARRAINQGLKKKSKGKKKYLEKKKKKEERNIPGLQLASQRL